jgi:hypothetical protein
MMVLSCLPPAFIEIDVEPNRDAKSSDESGDPKKDDERDHGSPSWEQLTPEQSTAHSLWLLPRRYTEIKNRSPATT